jgi:hypothetical protein
MRATLRAEEDFALMEINEAEEYLGLLREKMAIIQARVTGADEHIAMVREELDSDGLLDNPHSDHEDSISASSPPHSSDYTSPEHLTDMESDHDGSLHSDYDSDNVASPSYTLKHHSAAQGVGLGKDMHGEEGL